MQQKHVSSRQGGLGQKPEPPTHDHHAHAVQHADDRQAAHAAIRATTHQAHEK